MSWTIENAQKRVFNVFKRSKDKIYKEDIEALKLLNEELLNSQKSYINDNILFAKLLCVLLTNELLYRKDIKESLKAVSSDLLKPLDYHLEIMRMHLNSIDLEAHFNSLGLLNFDFWDVSQETKDKKNAIINRIQPEMLDKIKHNWTAENVNKSFYKTANEFLRDIDNYK